MKQGYNILNMANRNKKVKIKYTAAIYSIYNFRVLYKRKLFRKLRGVPNLFEIFLACNTFTEFDSILVFSVNYGMENWK